MGQANQGQAPTAKGQRPYPACMVQNWVEATESLEAD